MAVIIDHGMREMLVEQKDAFYYVTLMNENYAQPDLPEGVAVDVVRKCYWFSSYSCSSDEGYSLNSLKEVTLPGSGAILTEVIEAAPMPFIAQQLQASSGPIIAATGGFAWVLWGGCGQYCAGGYGNSER